MRTGFKELRDEQRSQGVTLEAIQDDIKLVVEATSPALEKQTVLEEKVEDHDAELVQHNVRLVKLENA